MAEDKVSKIQAGFRCDPLVYEEVKEIAGAEQRSISEIFAAMVVTQVQRYKQGGWSAVTKVGENE
jgi:hypothetical protein